MIAFFALTYLGLFALGLQGHNRLLYLPAMFDIAGEGNLPNSFSSLGLLACGGVAGLLYASSGNALERRGWGILAAGFSFMALDENAAIHDWVSELPISGSGVFTFIWVVPYIFIAATAILILLPFWWNLKRSLQVRFVVAGVIYLGSAVGMELWEAELYEASNYNDAIYQTWTMALHMVVEECGEMFGVAIFLRTFLTALGPYSLEGPARPSCRAENLTEDRQGVRVTATGVQVSSEGIGNLGGT
ncbi:hypothetical protein [Novosphingobium album (ex Hu et al. 2023)]|uniref:Thaumarchaeosortase n=1 Tax=Novosphingobium album (ex Hu et al. 2023) TaxID=2930093 RepID=A0ABT0AZ21_9SPHN|nr:hypothetical protein [Novosphingobium album (ex Hu et al. 2023)]MCJ2178037.1 hypothetical protein [Novosphingobium album (ex Hu et al. 2023)]